MNCDFDIRSLLAYYKYSFRVEDILRIKLAPERYCNKQKDSSITICDQSAVDSITARAGDIWDKTFQAGRKLDYKDVEFPNYVCVSVKNVGDIKSFVYAMNTLESYLKYQKKWLLLSRSSLYDEADENKTTINEMYYTYALAIELVDDMGNKKWKIASGDADRIPCILFMLKDEMWDKSLYDAFSIDELKEDDDYPFIDLEHFDVIVNPQFHVPYSRPDKELVDGQRQIAEIDEFADLKSFSSSDLCNFALDVFLKVRQTYDGVDKPSQYSEKAMKNLDQMIERLKKNKQVNLYCIASSDRSYNKGFFNILVKPPGYCGDRFV